MHPLCFKLCFTAALFITPLTPRISGSGSGPGDLTGDPSSRVQNVDQGAQVLLECIKPPEADRIEWSRENNKPLPEQHYFEGNLLVIPRITPDDGGIYYCTAIYTSGDSEPTSALVNVRNGEAMITHSIYPQTYSNTSKDDEKCFLSIKYLFHTLLLISQYALQTNQCQLAIQLSNDCNMLLSFSTIYFSTSATLCRAHYMLTCFVA